MSSGTGQSEGQAAGTPVEDDLRGPGPAPHPPLDGAVAAFFAGRDVLVSGASGFLGRVLLEKLLREAPAVGAVFVLVRPKRGKDPQQRLQEFVAVRLFDRLRREQPRALSKLVAVAGDVSLPRLGLSDADAAMLERRVAVVFHVAASVRFDEPLAKALLLNVRGTLEMCRLASRMHNLQAFVHVSTAYSNSDHLLIEEKLYPAAGDWQLYLKAAETLDSETLTILTSKIQGQYANTYIFTKALAEHVVNHFKQEHNLPIAIVRPSIVVQTEEEPFPGWIDNFNGPATVMWAEGLGVIHILLYDPNVMFDVIPCDYVINGMILTALKLPKLRAEKDLPIFNATATRHLYDFDKFQGIGSYIFSYLLNVQRVYKRYHFFATSIFFYCILFVIMDLPISLTLDGLAWLTKQKPRLLKLHRRAIVVAIKTHYFATHQFTFRNDKFLALRDILQPEEKKYYTLSTELIHSEPHTLRTMIENELYFFKNDLANGAKQDVIIEVLHYIACGLILTVIWKCGIPSLLLNSSVNLIHMILAI